MALLRGYSITPLNVHQATPLIATSVYRKNIASIPFAELIEVREGYWWDHQDLYVLRHREPPV